MTKKNRDKIYFRVFTVKGKLSELIEWLRLMSELEKLVDGYNNE